MTDAQPDVDDARALAFLRELARVDDLASGELRSGERLGRFAIVERLGSGGMGAVYEAKDETLGRAVALKVMREASDEARKRFLREARAAAAVSHPNLIVVHEVGEVETRAFIVMELVRGRTLRALAPTGDEAVRILRDIARGVAAAHAAGIVHRDLKPENVMVDDSGAVKVLDFGIARLAAGPADPHGATAMAVTGTGVIIGTPHYMSPEQALGIEVDARSDVYSFGVLAHELLTGKRPAPNPPRAGISAEIDGVLSRCLEADPAKRFADAGEIRDALEQTPAPRRSKRRLAIAIAVPVALAAALIAWKLSRSTGAPASRPLQAGPVQSANAEAITAYRGAFQQLRDAMFLEAVAELEHATKLDPGFAAAHLRLGLFKRFFHSPQEARQSFEIAVKNREQLDDHDRALLHASEPMVMRVPYDYAEARTRLLAALDEFPEDAELLMQLGYTYSELGEHAELLPLLDRIERIDPAAPYVWSSRAFTLLYLGDRAGAREAAIECKRLAPTQGGCAFELQKILDDTGACSELETVLRAWQIASADNSRIPRSLARVLLSEGRPLDAARDYFARARQLMPAAARTEAEQDDAIDIAWQTGDLALIERTLRGWLDEEWNELAAVTLIDVLEETDQRAATRSLAENYFARYTPEPLGTSDMDLYNDRTGLMLAALGRTGAIAHDELAARRDRWVRQLDAQIGGFYKKGVWAQAFAGPVRTVDEARDAVAVKPKELPPFFWFTGTYGAVGRTLVLGGRHAEAMPYLERATKRCTGRDPRDFYYLGLAQEVTDPKAACASYRVLLDRWRSAPRSVTLDRARERSAALSCPTD